ncbi:ATP-dependent zinc metalloprotease FtsH [Berryella wangjianweii]|uniref:ATP-dependent zinc metalloprotease FtsH n=1 Tax=Berryella wangjianweii TaxID=2734634 RepID=UPI0021BDB15B|nr:ATP-dependent zinc metalloprotease FtsH [Berryella wangjianweii]
MSQNDKNPQFKGKNLRIPIISMLLFVLLVSLTARQFMAMTGEGSKPTDTLITSEFIQAVQQDRVVSVTYDAGSYTVSGTYYPAVTAGATASEAFNGAFSSLSALASSQAPSGVSLPGIATSSIDTLKLGTERRYTATYVGQDSLINLLSKHPSTTYQVKLPSPWVEILSTVGPIILIGIILWVFFMQMNKAQNSQMGFGKAKAKKTMEERPDVKFADVAGVDEAVEEMREVKDFLANPQKYQALGAKIPRGCLLVGPPGTGKTLLARAVAGEAGVPFFSISGSDFVEMFVGVGASRVRDLFEQAKAAAPAIIFVDEIDAVGRQRGTGLGGGHDEREQTLNQLLVEMDGFEKNDSVVLIAATNRSDILDPALLRPGRFDRQIVVDVPDVKGRRQILKVHAQDKPLGSDVDLDSIASLTPGFTGADLMNLMNESALLTARRDKKVITQREISDSMERIIAGPERKGRVMNEKTKRIISYHECGHALVGFTLEHADPVHKISIISRGRALGYTLSIPDEDKVLDSKNQIRDELAVFMGGRVAEEIFIGDITTGASNDLERATKMARAMVTRYGMSTELGTQVFGQPNHEVFLGRDYGNTQDYSDETARRIDAEVARIMKEAYDRAYRILSDNREHMHVMAAVLLERETVEGEACQALLRNEWDEYLRREPELIEKREREEAEARKRDEEMQRAGASLQGGAAGGASTGSTADAGEQPSWLSSQVANPAGQAAPAAPAAPTAPQPPQVPAAPAAPAAPTTPAAPAAPASGAEADDAKGGTSDGRS